MNTRKSRQERPKSLLRVLQVLKRRHAYLDWSMVTAHARKWKMLYLYASSDISPEDFTMRIKEVERMIKHVHPQQMCKAENVQGTDKNGRHHYTVWIPLTLRTTKDFEKFFPAKRPTL